MCCNNHNQCSCCNNWYNNSCCNNWYNNRSDCCCCRQRVAFITQPILRPITPTPTPQTGNAVYAVGTTGTVADLAIIPLSFGTSTPATTLSVSNNSVIVPDGVYSVSYGATGTLTTATEDGTLAVQLYANGTPIANEIISTNASGTLPGNVSKTILYTANTPTALSLYNVSGTDITLTSSNITVQKLA